MFASLRIWFRSLAAVLLAVGFAPRAEAGWVTIRNETSKPVVVQQSVSWNGELRRAKPIRLFPGETSREYISTPATRKVEVLDGINPTVTLHTSTITVSHENQTFVVTTDSRGIQFVPVVPTATAARPR